MEAAVAFVLGEDADPRPGRYWYPDAVERTGSFRPHDERGVETNLPHFTELRPGVSFSFAVPRRRIEIDGSRY